MAENTNPQGYGQAAQALVLVGTEKVPKPTSADHLEALTNALLGYRKEAMAARTASGIEQIWQEDEDAYRGLDEANKGTAAALYKPLTLTGPFVQKERADSHRATAFLNITRPYVDAASARVADMLFPTDDRPWALKPTPKQDLADAAAEAAEQAAQNPQMAVMAEFLQEEITRQRATVERVQTQIDDWLVDSKFRRLGRKIVNDAARVGTGVLKGPVPMKIAGRTQPGSKAIKVQNLFPDPGCGENIHNGRFVWEREDASARRLREMLGESKDPRSGFIREQLIACLEEGERKEGENPSEGGVPRSRPPYTLWYFTGQVPVTQLEACGCVMPEGAGPTISASILMCNDRVVRTSKQPLEESFPYDLFRWQDMDGFWAGIGVGRQMETPQRMLNAAGRNMLDNAAFSAGPMLVFWKGIIEPRDSNDWSIKPFKQWVVKEGITADIDIKQVQNAIMAITIPNLQEPLMRIIQFAMKLAEDTTGLPMLLQGQMGNAPETVGGMQMLTNAASGVLRRLAKDFDDDLTEPHISRYYRWTQKFGSRTLRGEATVDARGSSTLVERDLQTMAIQNMSAWVTNPEFGLDPKRWAEEYLKSQRFDVKRFQPQTEEREQELAALMNQPDPKAEATKESAMIRANALTQQAETEGKVELAEAQLKSEDAERDRAHDFQMKLLDYRISVLDYAQRKDIDVGVAQEELAGVRLEEAGLG